jgi:hypothetical protein
VPYFTPKWTRGEFYISKDLIDKLVEDVVFTNYARRDRPIAYVQLFEDPPSLTADEILSAGGLEV